MNKMFIALSLVVFGLFLSSSPSVAQGLEGNADNGKELYVAYSCYACHGYTGETARVRLNPLLFTLEDFVEYLRNPPEVLGAGGFGMPFSMPAYAGPDVSGQDLADVYAYLRSLPSTSLDPENIPLLNGD